MKNLLGLLDLLSLPCYCSVMTNTTTPARFSDNVPAQARPASFRAASAPVAGDGWVFMPASRHSASSSFSPARAAASASARALRDQGQTAWAAVGPGGVWGTFVAV